MIIIRIFGVFFCIFALFSISVANPTDSIEFVFSGSTLWSHVGDVCIQDDYAFCAMQHGMMIIDVSDPDNPLTVSKYFLSSGRALDITVIGNLAYLICGSDGIQIIDITDKSFPQKINEYIEDYWSASEITIVGDYAYIFSISNLPGEGFAIFDISDPAFPVRAGAYSNYVVKKPITVQGDYFYACGYNGIDIIDISDPAAPDSINTIEVPRTTRTAAIDDTLAYVMNDSAMYVFNISNLHSPLQIGHIDYDTIARVPIDIQIVGNYAYTTHGLYDSYRTDGGFFIYDISNPYSPEIVNHLPQSAYSVSIFGDKVGVTDFDRYYHIYDLTDPVNPEIYLDIEIPDTRSWGFRGIETNGLYAYVALGPSDLNVVDISNPEDPVALSGDYLTGGAYELAIRDNYLYVASGSYDDNGLYVFDITNFEEPSQIGFYSYSSPQEVTLSGDYAFMAGNHGNSIILDISNPAIPELVATYRAGSITWGVAVNGNYAYHANFSGIKIVDISNINEPVVVDSLRPHYSNYYDAIIYKGYLVTGAGDGWFEVFDLADPAMPASVAELRLTSEVFSDINGITAYGNYIFAAVGYAGFSLINMENPETPFVVTEKTFSGEAQDIAVFDGYAYVVDQYGMASYSINLPSCCVTAGDANYDGTFDVADIVYLINLVFRKGPPVNCPDAAETNSDGRVNVVDIVYLINTVFKFGPEPQCPDY